MAPKWPFTKGLHKLGNGAWGYLQPDGGWCLNNTGLNVDGDHALAFADGEHARPARNMRKTAATIAAAIAATTIPASAQEAPAPGLELLYRSIVTLGPAIEVGKTARGTRRIIPITGGTFEGPKMRGEILPMGWDWQLDRADGCKEIIADYFLRTDDGVVINLVNSGALCRPGGDGTATPSRTSPVFEAPLGKYDWLSKGGYIGTLSGDLTAKVPTVVITIYRAN